MNIRGLLRRSQPLCRVALGAKFVCWHPSTVFRIVSSVTGSRPMALLSVRVYWKLAEQALWGWPVLNHDIDQSSIGQDWGTTSRLRCLRRRPGTPADILYSAQRILWEDLAASGIGTPKLVGRVLLNSVLTTTNLSHKC